MPLDKYEQPPPAPLPPQARIAIGVIAAGALVSSVMIIALLKDIALPLRVMIAAGDVLITGLACWAISRAARKR